MSVLSGEEEEYTKGRELDECVWHCEEKKGQSVKKGNLINMCVSSSKYLGDGEDDQKYSMASLFNNCIAPPLQNDV